MSLRPERTIPDTELDPYSVALCTYNGARFIEQQLQSIADQHLKPDEVVICDDGSTDNTLKLIEQFSQNNPYLNIRLYRNSENLGYVANFEQAIKLCRNEYIFLSDQDDIWVPEKSAIQLSYMLAPNTLLSFSNAVRISDKSEALSPDLWSCVNFNDLRQHQLCNGHSLEVLSRHNVVTGATVAFRKDFSLASMPFPKCYPHDAWLALNAALQNGLVCIDQQLIQYRQHDMNTLGAHYISPLQKAWRALWKPRDKFPKDFYQRLEIFSQLIEDQRFPVDFRGKLNMVLRFQTFRLAVIEQRTPPLEGLKEVLKWSRDGLYYSHGAGWRSILTDVLQLIRSMPYRVIARCNSGKKEK